MGTFLLPTQSALAQQCSPDIACGVSINPASGSKVVIGQAITINFVKAGITASSCFITNGNTWLASPDGAGGQITSYIMTNFVLATANTEINCAGATGLPGGDTSCLGYTTTYIVNAADINQPLSLGSPTVLPIKFAADGVQTFPPQANRIHFFAAAEGAGFNDNLFTSFSGNAYGQGQVSLTVVRPGLTIDKICDTNCFLYGAPVSFHGTICNTGDVTVVGITVTDTPEGGSPMAVTAFAATTSSGRTFDGSLTNGECVTYSGSYSPAGAGVALCGPFTDTVVVQGTTTGISSNFNVFATNSATCNVCTTPCIAVTKDCTPAVVGQTQTVSGTVTNCGDVTLTNISVVDNVVGSITNGVSLAPGESFTYSKSFTAVCGGNTNIVTASGTGLCGGPVTATATNICVVTENPCIEVTKNCDTVNPGETNTVSGVVTNCGNVRLINVCVVDNLYGTLICIEELAPGGSQSYSRQVVNSPCSDTTNVVTATGQTICGTVVSNTATAVCSVRCLPPQICVTKEVACELPAGCDSYSHLAIGAKSADNAECPSFCYRVRVTNCGQEALTNVTVVDNVITNLSLCNFPTTLGVGQTVECILSGVVHCEDVTNTVTATGVGINSGITVTTNDTAAVNVRSISIACELTVNGQSSEEIQCDQELHFITNAVRICNTGELPLVATIFAPIIVALGGDCTNVASLELTLAPRGQPGDCTNILLCIDAVTCPTDCGLAFSNWVQVTAVVDVTKTNVCAYTRNQSNEVVAVSTTTECAAVVTCSPLEACRTTGGGRQDDPLVFPADVRYVTHGGQVGAPVGNHVCIVTTNFTLGNPCIHGRWTHVRHQQGSSEGNFHARYYDTLECACLDTNTTATVVTIPNIVGGGSQTYTNLVYGPGTTVDGVCNPGHNPAGPEPRPAPANKIVFTGVGDWTDTNGRRAPRSVLFRVDLEDRSEPGGSHPKGGTPPADRYRIRIWVLTTDELMQLRGAGPDRFLLNFRNAISACNGINVQDGATVPNGAEAFGVRHPDVDDGGELERGNHQIHPSIKDCDPFNPTGPGLPPGGN